MSNNQVVAGVAPEPLDVTVGRNVHVRMWDSRVTQTQLSKQLGMNQSTLGRKLRGERGWSLDELALVASIFNTTIDGLCAPRDSNPEPTDSGSAARIAEVIYLPLGGAA